MGRGKQRWTWVGTGREGNWRYLEPAKAGGHAGANRQRIGGQPVFMGRAFTPLKPGRVSHPPSSVKPGAGTKSPCSCSPTRGVGLEQGPTARAAGWD